MVVIESKKTGGWNRTQVGMLMGLLLLLNGCRMMPAALHSEMTEAHILERSRGQFIQQEALLEKMLQARVIYLGEQHDNPYHHRLQRTILEQLIARGKRPALGFEFFSRDQTAWLMHFSVGKPSAFALKQSADPETFVRKKLGWEENPSWAHYFPLMELARQHHLPLFGTDLPDGLRMRLTRNGLAGLSAIEQAEWLPTGFEQADYRHLMIKKLARSHCGMAPESLLDRLYETWIARNDTMARSIALMLETLPDDPVVMVLGSGHVAHDMGVYERVAALKPGVQQLNLGFQESDTLPPASLAQYLKPEQIGQTLFPTEHQFFWFTPPAPSDADPCAQLMHHKPASNKQSAE